MFSIAIIITGLGTGLFKANISPLVAEQYRRTKLFIREEKNGERVIVDPVLTVSSIYMVCDALGLYLGYNLIDVSISTFTCLLTLALSSDKSA